MKRLLCITLCFSAFQIASGGRNELLLDAAPRFWHLGDTLKAVPQE